MTVGLLKPRLDYTALGADEAQPKIADLEAALPALTAFHASLLANNHALLLEATQPDTIKPKLMAVQGNVIRLMKEIAELEKRTLLSCRGRAHGRVRLRKDTGEVERLVAETALAGAAEELWIAQGGFNYVEVEVKRLQVDAGEREARRAEREEKKTERGKQGSLRQAQGLFAGLTGYWLDKQPRRRGRRRRTRARLGWGEVGPRLSSWPGRSRSSTGESVRLTTGWTTSGSTTVSPVPSDVLESLKLLTGFVGLQPR